jgi:hypothetical protein
MEAWLEKNNFNMGTNEQSERVSTVTSLIPSPFLQKGIKITIMIY